MSRRNWEALEYFMAGGGRFAIATGRALAAFIKFADQVPMNAPGIVCNGAALYDFQKGEYLETILLDESTAAGTGDSGPIPHAGGGGIPH